MANPILQAILNRGAKSTTRPKAATGIGFDPERKFYHGTNAPDINEFDLDKVDVGVHIAPDYETATNRLLDTRSGERANTRTFPNEFETGANIIPLHARMNKTLEVPDLGAWDDPDRVATGISDYFQWADVEKGQGLSKKAIEELDSLTDYPFENKRQYFDKIREILNREGYDSIRYNNTFEGMGGRAIREATAEFHKMQDQIDAMRSLAFDRRKQWINDQVTKGGDRYQLERNTSVESFLTPEEVAMTSALKDDMKVYFQPHMDDPNMQVASEAVQYDPYSYIVMNPADLRAVTAKFDPKKSKSANLTAAQAGMGAGGILGALAAPEEAEANAVAKAVTKAINVRKDKAADLDYADLIISGDKKYETRNTDSLRPYVGQRMGIARTGEGKAKAIGEVDIGEPIVADEALFRQLQDQHLVPQGSAFDIQSGGTKYLYPVSNPTRYDQAKDVAHGIVARRILGGGLLGALGAGQSGQAEASPRIMRNVSEAIQANPNEGMIAPNDILDALMGFLAPQAMGDATMDAYNRNRIR